MPSQGVRPGSVCQLSDRKKMKIREKPKISLLGFIIGFITLISSKIVISLMKDFDKHVHAYETKYVLTRQILIVVLISNMHTNLIISIAYIVIMRFA